MQLLRSQSRCAHSNPRQLLRYERVAWLPMKLLVKLCRFLPSFCFCCRVFGAGGCHFREKLSDLSHRWRWIILSLSVHHQQRQHTAHRSGWVYMTEFFGVSFWKLKKKNSPVHFPKAKDACPWEHCAKEIPLSITTFTALSVYTGWSLSRLS